MGLVFRTASGEAAVAPLSFFLIIGTKKILPFTAGALDIYKHSSVER